MNMHNSGLWITSEIGRLREAIVHTPGRELELVTPRNFGRMLMEDILNLKAAQEDHQELLDTLRHAGVRIYQVRDLLHEMILSLSENDRHNLINAICDLEGCTSAYRRRMHRLTPEGLTEVCIVGELQQESLTRFLRQDLYALPPIPNLMFVRDCAAVVNRSVILSTMAHSVRARESLLFEWIFRHHPVFHTTEAPSWLWLEEAEERRNKYLAIRGTTGIPHLMLEGANFRLRGVKTLSVGGEEFTDPKALVTSDDIILEADDLKLSVGSHFVLEAGNILVLSDDALLIGCNERASPAAIDALAQEMLERRSRIKTILVAIFAPETKFFKHHLDTGFAILHYDRKGLECLAHQPMIEAQGASITVVKMAFERGHLRVQPLPDLRTALKQVEAFSEAKIKPFITCGCEQRKTVEDRIHQEREWHHQAVNVLALAPGKLVAFRRNRRTIELLTRDDNGYGYEEVPARSQDGKLGFLDWPDHRVSEWFEDPEQKTIITVRDEELTRAHGGPRSLVLPLRRDPL